MEEEFIKNQERLKPQDEKNEVSVRTCIFELLKKLLITLSNVVIKYAEADVDSHKTR